MAESFTKVEHPEQIIEVLSRLPDLKEPDNGSYTKKSPLIATLFAEQVGNQIETKIRISNPNDFEWFIKNEMMNDAAIYLGDADDKFLGHYPSSSYPDNIDILIHITDESYDLLKPGDSIELRYSIPAELFYRLGKGGDMYITYTNGGIPPSISEALTDDYLVGKISNAARVRCHHYNKVKEQYSCEVEVLPGQPVLKS